MKKSIILLAALTFVSFMVILSCTKPPIEEPGGPDPDPDPDPIQPTASFSYAPNKDIIADVTTVSFYDNSSGDVESYYWDFGSYESTSTKANPSYRFDREGYKQIELTVSGPAGNDSKTVNIRVHAMDPNLHNYSAFSTQATGHIQDLRNLGLKIGRLKVRNNYGGPVKIVLYHPDSWLEGIYTGFGQWNLPTNSTYYLNASNGQNMYIGNDWGIQVLFENGVKSCVRCLGLLSSFQNGEFYVLASDVYNG